MGKKEIEKQIRDYLTGLCETLIPDYEPKDERIWSQREDMERYFDRFFSDMAENLRSQCPASLPSEVLKKNWLHIVNKFVPEHKREEFYHIIDKYCRFSYPTGMYRRTVRSRTCEGLNQYVLKNIFTSYYYLDFYAKTAEEYYSEEKTAFRMEMEQMLTYYDRLSVSSMDLIIAGELDFSQTSLARVLKDIILSENNTAAVSREMILGIMRSDCEELHQLTGDFLLAARLQEGVRQVICETMDMGTAEAFFTCFKVIVDNDLIRYSSVKRAVATWTGLCCPENQERVMRKILAVMAKALDDNGCIHELLESKDNLELYLGLWAQGFYEVEDAMESCRKIIRSGEKNQRLLVSYYNLSLQSPRFAMQSAALMLETYPEDMEMCAAFLPTYLKDSGSLMYRALCGQNGRQYREKYVYAPIPCTEYFSGEEQARDHFFILQKLHDSLPPKGRVYSPCIFPWYEVEIHPSDLAEKMVLIAYMLQDNRLIDAVCPLLPEISSGNRDTAVSLLLHEPKTPTQQKALLSSLRDKAADARKAAFHIVSKMKLTAKDYQEIQKLLKYKTSDIRTSALTLLEKQEDDLLAESIKTLLSDKKEENRLGGLDLLTRLKKKKDRQDLFAGCSAFLSQMPAVTPKEQVIITELTKDASLEKPSAKDGYGLYRPDAPWDIPAFRGDTEFIILLFHRKGRELHKILQKLEELYTANRYFEYRDIGGTERLLDSHFNLLERKEKEPVPKDFIDRYPCSHLWKKFYREEIKDFATLLNLEIFITGSENDFFYNGLRKLFLPVAEKIFGEDYLDVDLKDYDHASCISSVIRNLFTTYSNREENRKFLKDTAYSMIAVFLQEPMEMTRKEGVKQRYGTRKETVYALNASWFHPFVETIKNWETNDEFDKMFQTCEAVNRFYGKNVIELRILDYIKAWKRNLVSKDNVYQAIFDSAGLKESLRQLSPIVRYPQERLHVEHQKFLDSDGDFEQNPVFRSALEIYYSIVEMILKTELKRSELPTEFSHAVSAISKIQGTAHMVDILVALGADKLERSGYYSYYGNYDNKKSCLSHLLYVSEPLPHESGETLKMLLKGKKIPEKRLIETAMYNPGWIDSIAQYLKWDGLKSGVYYFIAHMNEYFSDRTRAVIAKYTPLTMEELNDGAFDLNWFLECSEKLGEKHFQMLYDSAKYISDGNKHTRARKYADAARGKVNARDLEAAISEKRNKDLLMSYGLIPVKDSEETLGRYQFIQKFVKESRQFGAQRRASEKKAADIALQNLSILLGYGDVTRLTLSMETKLAEQMAPFFSDREIQDILMRISIDETGKPSLVCIKGGKSLKSVPSKLKKNPQVMEINDVLKQLKEQHSRAKSMLEQFMEDGEAFSFQEVRELLKNPVIAPMLKTLVFVSEHNTGFLTDVSGSGKNPDPLSHDAKSPDSVLYSPEGTPCRLKAECRLRIAHSYDLWKAKVWPDYQKLLFDQKIIQPFKQVFRELYVKTTDELGKFNSMRYSGNQIQPKKTAACLRGRHWIADYEDGLQKVYYKENIVARIYALADWFSPSDIEAPTLEWVEFSDRKTFQPLKIDDIPERIFSEVMRDVDLAVSVAHAGGVDPETSHSTMEMRRVILEYNLPLFGLANVSFHGHHAVIEGKRGTYTVHLGSGAVFKQGGAQIAVLPVHSQHRGKLFLPFVDEDPKTAEIMSKILLFAEDMKIKDPFILEQL